jgi:phage shock protein A
MGRIQSRLALFFNVKSSAALDQLEDPREILDYAYGEQQTHLRAVRRGLVEVAAARQQLEHQAARLRTRAARLDEQARRALRANREDLARQALERKQSTLAEVRVLNDQLASIAKDEERLRQSDQQLTRHVERFRFQRSVASARYVAAQAQVSVGEALAGLVTSSEEAELSMAVERSEERIEQMSARAEAITALSETGALQPRGDSLERELEGLESADAVERELAALKAELADMGQPSEAAGPSADTEEHS